MFDPQAPALLDPQARALIDLIIQRGLPPVHTLSAAEARRMYLERRFFTQPAPPPLPEVRALRSAGGVPLRLYRPAVGGEAVLVYFHGGGWVIGDLETHDVLCRQLCLASGASVVSVDYRLAPEHPFPAGFDDCLEATRWLRQEAAALGLDPARLAVGGDSAGGNLAAAVCLAMRDAGEPLPAYQLLIYPATDQRAGTPSHQACGQGYLLTADSISYYRGHYLPEVAQWTDWRASPLLAASHAGLPPALVLTAGYDPLRDEGRQYADALSAAGTPAQYVCFERQIHGFITMSKVLTEARSAVALCGAALREALSPPAA